MNNSKNWGYISIRGNGTRKQTNKQQISIKKFIGGERYAKPGPFSGAGLISGAPLYFRPIRRTRPPRKIRVLMNIIISSIAISLLQGACAPCLNPCLYQSMNFQRKSCISLKVVTLMHSTSSPSKKSQSSAIT